MASIYFCRRIFRLTSAKSGSVGSLFIHNLYPLLFPRSQCRALRWRGFCLKSLLTTNNSRVVPHLGGDISRRRRYSSVIPFEVAECLGQPLNRGNLGLFSRITVPMSANATTARTLWEKISTACVYRNADQCRHLKTIQLFPVNDIAKACIGRRSRIKTVNRI